MEYTTNQLATMFNVLPTSITHVKFKLGLEVESRKIDGVKMNIYTEDQVNLMTEYFNNRTKAEKRDFLLKRKIQNWRDKKNQQPEEDQSHPLVTDRRYLQVNVWPDITPACFADLEEADGCSYAQYKANCRRIINQRRYGK